MATELARLAGELLGARAAAATMVRRLDHLTDPLTGAMPAELSLCLSLTDRRTRLLGDMARLGIDARRMTIEQENMNALVVAQGPMSTR